MADEIKKNNKHLINAPAGSGKTTYIRNQLKSICINKPESRILCHKEELLNQCKNKLFDLVELAVDTARNENEKLVELIDQLGYMYEPTLTDYLECLENSFEFGTDENTFEVWLV